MTVVVGSSASRMEDAMPTLSGPSPKDPGVAGPTWCMKVREEGGESASSRNSNTHTSTKTVSTCYEPSSRRARKGSGTAVSTHDECSSASEGEQGDGASGSVGSILAGTVVPFFPSCCWFKVPLYSNLPKEG